MKTTLSLLIFCQILFGFGIWKAYAQTPEPFPCNAKMFISNNDTLYEYKSSGIVEKLFYVGNINALAFSPTGYLWAFDEDAQSIVVIAKDSSKVSISVTNLPTGTADYNVGTIDGNGYYYICYGENANRYYIIDTDPARVATYGKLVDPTATNGVVPYSIDNRTTKGTAIPSAEIEKFADWAINPLDNMLYTMTNSTSTRPFRIVAYNPVTGVRHSISPAITGGNIQNSPNGTSFGAIFIDLYDNFYVFGNARGHLYSINLGNNAATQLSTTAISSNNIDGALCPLMNTPLPVKLQNFEALLINDEINLFWQTIKEENCAGFEIERSLDGSKWSPIGFENSKATQGNSNSLVSYNFKDYFDHIKGKIHYRLRQKDFDNTYAYSQVSTIELDNNQNLLVFPNPTKDYISINNLSGKEHITIIDNLGKELLHIIAKKNQETIDLMNIPTGVYFIKIGDIKGNVLIKKVVIQK